MFTILCLQTLKMIIVSLEVTRPVKVYDGLINKTFHVKALMSRESMSRRLK